VPAPRPALHGTLRLSRFAPRNVQREWTCRVGKGGHGVLFDGAAQVRRAHAVRSTRARGALSSGRRKNRTRWLCQSYVTEPVHMTPPTPPASRPAGNLTGFTAAHEPFNPRMKFQPIKNRIRPSGGDSGKWNTIFSCGPIAPLAGRRARIVAARLDTCRPSPCASGEGTDGAFSVLDPRGFYSTSGGLFREPIHDALRCVAPVDAHCALWSRTNRAQISRLSRARTRTARPLRHRRLISEDNLEGGNSGSTDRSSKHASPRNCASSAPVDSLSR
jgi:hypothetical protein